MSSARFRHRSLLSTARGAPRREHDAGEQECQERAESGTIHGQRHGRRSERSERRAAPRRSRGRWSAVGTHSPRRCRPSRCPPSRVSGPTNGASAASRRWRSPPSATSSRSSGRKRRSNSRDHGARVGRRDRRRSPTWRGAPRASVHRHQHLRHRRAAGRRGAARSSESSAPPCSRQSRGRGATASVWRLRGRDRVACHLGAVETVLHAHADRRIAGGALEEPPSCFVPEARDLRFGDLDARARARRGSKVAGVELDQPERADRRSRRAALIRRLRRRASAARARAAPDSEPLPHEVGRAVARAASAGSPSTARAARERRDHEPVPARRAPCRRDAAARLCERAASRLRPASRAASLGFRGLDRRAPRATSFDRARLVQDRGAVLEVARSGVTP